MQSHNALGLVLSHPTQKAIETPTSECSKQKPLLCSHLPVTFDNVGVVQLQSNTHFSNDTVHLFIVKVIVPLLNLAPGHVNPLLFVKSSVNLFKAPAAHRMPEAGVPPTGVVLDRFIILLFLLSTSPVADGVGRVPIQPGIDGPIQQSAVKPSIPCLRHLKWLMRRKSQAASCCHRSWGSYWPPR
jgi:hypothetical protein